ncbi:MAG: selenate reductase [Anaerocolumna sp.]
MSDKMRPVPFKELLLQALCEFKQNGSFFYVPVEKIDDRIRKVTLSGKEVESPIGPASGPHTQLAQNIVSAYAAGARYFELKTVQILDGDSLGLQKPCIYVKDEAYNTEWSTELTSYQALAEYIKAWYLLKLLIKEFHLGDINGFVFNMSVGYDLGGIQSEKIDYFIEGMKDAAATESFKECEHTTLGNLDWFSAITAEYVKNIDSHISNTITLSTMHGCPANEIERIMMYLIEEKKLNTYLKCNPTLLGADEVGKILNDMGYDYISFDTEVFKQDISFDAVVGLIKKLQPAGDKNQLEFGIKLTNTFPVKITNQELQGENMYMSGTALYPLTIGVAAKLSGALDKKVSISYSGGADAGNIGAIYETGICPVTVSTLLLKTGGYKNLSKLNKALARHPVDQPRAIQVDKIKKLAEEALFDQSYFRTPDKFINIQNTDYSPYCSTCRNCVDVCPNRANVLYERNHKKYTIHQDALCNECGNCSYSCILGHVPYKEKFTVFLTEADLFDSKNNGFYQDEQVLIIRWMGQIHKGNKKEMNRIAGDIMDLINYINIPAVV